MPTKTPGNQSACRVVSPGTEANNNNSFQSPPLVVVRCWGGSDCSQQSQAEQKQLQDQITTQEMEITITVPIQKKRENFKRGEQGDFSQVVSRIEN